jgi:site-specific DNA-methyltransferase (adenine-specific)
MSTRLFHGDSLALLRSMPDRSVDAVITDPPYSSGGQYRGDRMAATSTKYQSSDAAKMPDFSGDNRDQRSWGYWSTLWLSECRRIARPGAPIVVFSDWRQLPTATDVLQSAGWLWRGIACWDKTQGARPQVGRFKAQCEYMAWGSNGPMPMVAGRPCLPGCFRHVSPRKRQHMTQKPLQLMVEVLGIVPPGGTVLDPFMGSGTTGEAARLLGLPFIGIESDPVIFDGAAARLEAAA